MTTRGGNRTAVLVLGAGGSWEARALAELEARSALVVFKRCVDVTDLLATASTGQAQVAVVAADAPELDPRALEHLTRHGVRVVGVAADPHAVRDGMLGAGARAVVAADDPASLPGAVLAAAEDPGPPDTGSGGEPTRAGPAQPPGTGATFAIWGPTGAPGRTTVALGLAGELAKRGTDPLVLDLDPWGGAVAQHLGMLEDVSGVLASARADGLGALGRDFAGLQRRVAGLRVVTGLPRPDRWSEVRPGTVPELVRLGRRQGSVVADVGFCLEDDPEAEYVGRAARTTMTLEALDAVDTVVAVGSADPVGLSRLVRGLTELRERLGTQRVAVVVNRMRGSLGWSEAEVATMIADFARTSGVHFLPDDRAATDRALLTGRTLTEAGDSGLARAIAALADDLLPTAGSPRRRRVSRRRAGRARRS